MEGFVDDSRFFPKTPPELGSRLVFWKRGLGATSAGAALSSTRNARFYKNVALVYAKRPVGRPVAVRWPSGALSSTRNGHFNIKSRSRLRETVRRPFPGCSVALSSTRNGHFNIKSRSRLRETVPRPSPVSSVALSSTRNGHFYIYKISLSSTRNGPLAVPCASGRFLPT